jgi:transcriptional regulator with XRE-family HTH domain
MKAKDFNKAMGLVVRRHRLLQGLNQAAVGKQISVSYQQVQKGESGQNAFSAFQLTRIAELFGIAVADLYQEAGLEKREPILTEAQSDGFLAARYVGKIRDPKLRTNLVDFARKLAYAGAAA